MEKNLLVEGLSESWEKVFSENIDLKTVQSIPTKVYALGGIEEIGKNMYCIEHDDELIVIDIGIKFVNRRHFPGLSGVIPSVQYLKDNQHKIKALIISHGHEDHIGGIVHVLKQVNFPTIYSPIIASELIKRKISENGIPTQNIVLYSDQSVFLTKHFVIDFYRVNHSIPDSFGVAFGTPNGIMVFSGDFRFDFNSRDDKFDLHKVGKISDRGVDLLLCESTNAEQPGWNESEKGVVNELHNIMSSVKGRIIITFFASNIGRIEEVFQLAVSLKKKIVILGHSIDANIAASQHAGYLKFDAKNLISAKDASTFPDNEILIICTGSQGEDTSALSNISKNKHPHIKLKSSDSIIFSSNIIPGNTYAVESLINRLHKSGCNIFLNSPDLRIHSSGHATKLEQQLFVSLIRPKYIVPVHGEIRMLKALSRNCVEIGLDAQKILIVKNGDVVHLLNREAYISDEKVDASLIYIDGDEITHEGEDLSRERAQLGERGVLVMHVFVDTKKEVVHSISPMASAGSYFLDPNLSKSFQNSIYKEVRSLLKEKISCEEMQKRLVQFLFKELYAGKKQRPNIEIFVTDSDQAELTKNPILPKVLQDSDSTQQPSS